jgi:hypothetical protein
LDSTSAGGGGTPGGSNTQLQYNNNGAFGGTTGATTSGGVVTMTSPIIANIAPGANFTLTQNSVVPFTSVNTGAVANTLYLTTGKVGIGTNNPSKQLDITGSFNLPVTSASGTNGVIYQGGNRFIHSYHPTALFGNLFIGKDSGNFSLTSTAQDNIGLGVNTLDVLSSGTGNVAIGTSTLGLLQSGLTNVGVGHGVLAAVVSGDDNTAIGHNALSGFAAPTGGTAAVATVADKNTAVGSFSGVSNNTWVNTTAIGYNAVATASNMVRIGNTAVTVIQGQVAPTVGSDIRFKKDIVDSDLGLDFLLKLRPVSYKLKTEGLNEGTSYGFIAQEIESILDGKNTKMIYTENTKDAYKYVRYDDLIAPTVKAIQEQQKQIEALKAEIELLKKK